MASMEQRFQYGVRTLLWAMFWLSIAAGAFSYLGRLRYAHLSPIPHFILFGVFLVLTFLFVVTPCMALGALYDRTKLGLAIGAGLAIFFVSAMFFAAVFTVESRSANGRVQTILPQIEANQSIKRPAE